MTSTPLRTAELEAAALGMLEANQLVPSAELLAAVAALLDGAGIAAGDGRVADRLTARTLRYYRSLGMVDPPAARQANTNLFSRRHALQMAAARAVQAAERAPIAEVQRRLHGLTDTDLAATFAAAARAADGPAPAPRAAFWAAPAVAADPAAAAPASTPALVLAAAPGVTVTLTGAARALDPAAIAAAFQTLLTHPSSHPAPNGDPR